MEEKMNGLQTTITKLKEEAASKSTSTISKSYVYTT